MNQSIKINVEKLQGACIRGLKGSSGVVKQCIIIPCDDNPCIFRGEKGTYLNITAIEMKNPKYDSTHVLKPDTPKEVYEQMSDEQRQAIPILGDMKPIGPQQAAPAPALSAEQIENAEDLPF